MYDTFAKAVGQVGLPLNVEKKNILTNEAQPQNMFGTRDGLTLEVKNRNDSEKRLGYILTAGESVMQHVDLTCHIEHLVFLRRTACA